MTESATPSRLPTPTPRRHRYAGEHPRQLLTDEWKHGCGVSGTLLCLIALWFCGQCVWFGGTELWRRIQDWPDSFTLGGVLWMAMAMVGMPIALLIVGGIVAGIGRFMVGGLVLRRARGSILAYYERRVSPVAEDSRGVEASYFRDGEVVARHCRALDRWAAAHGVPGVSDFGFVDDRVPNGHESGRTPVFYDPVVACRALAVWRSGAGDAEAVPMPGEERERLREALGRWASQWELARERDIGICLIVRNEYCAQGLDWALDRRIGSFR